MSTRTIREFAARNGVMVIYECNDGPVAYGPFAHVEIARTWCDARKAKGVKFHIIPYHEPEYWPTTKR